MRAGFVIVAEVIFQQSAQVIVTNDHDMIQALASTFAWVCGPFSASIAKRFAQKSQIQASAILHARVALPIVD